MARKRVEVNFRIVRLPEADQEFLPKGKFPVVLDYPLDKVYKFEVQGPMTVVQLCCRIAKEYKEVIYADCEKYGVWGHVIDDLFIESLKLDDDDNVHVGMGS